MIFCFTYGFIVELNGTFNVEFGNINYSNIPLLLGEVSTYSKNMAAHYTGDQYNDVIMGAMAFQITSLTIVYSNVYSGADQRKHQSSALLAFVRWIHRWPVNSPHKWPVTREILHLMTSSWCPRSSTDGRQFIPNWRVNWYKYNLRWWQGYYLIVTNHVLLNVRYLQTWNRTLKITAT